MESLPNDLKQKINQIIDHQPESKQVFLQLIDYLTDDKVHKKVKFENDDLNKQIKLTDDDVIYKDISFVLPDRKKGYLIITKTDIAIVILPPAVKEDLSKLSEISVDFIFSKKDFLNALVLQIPDKAKPQWNFLLVSKKNSDPIIQLSLHEASVAKHIARGQIGASLSLKESILSSFSFLPIQQAAESSCFSCHRGSKEGQLYLLDGWIFFGFKKPLLLFNVDDIDSVSYSSITRMTFNLIIKLLNPIPEGQEFEFSMIDQKDYESINSYIMKYDLNNQSMSEERRAKQATKQAEYSNELESAIKTENSMDSHEKPADIGQADLPSSDEEDDVNYEGGDSDSQSDSEEENSGEEAKESEEEAQETDDEDNVKEE